MLIFSGCDNDAKFIAASNDFQWINAQQLERWKEELGWNNEVLPSWSWVGGISIQQQGLEEDLSEGIDMALPSEENLPSRRLLVAKKVNWETQPGVSFPSLMPVTSARVIENKLVVESSPLSSDFLDIISSERSNQVGEYVLLDHPKGWMGIIGQVFIEGQNGEVSPVADARLSIPRSPLRTWSYNKGGYFLAVPLGEETYIKSIMPEISNLYNFDDTSEAGFAYVSTDQISESVKLRSEQMFQKPANWFADRVTKWLGQRTVVHGDWNVLQIPIYHYQSIRSQVYDTPAGAAVEDDLTAQAKGMGLSRGGDWQRDLDCDGLTKSGLGSIHSYIGGKGWHVLGNVDIVTQDVRTYFPLIGEQIDTNEGFLILSNGDGRFRGTGEIYPSLKPLGQFTSTLWQEMRVPSTAKSIQIRMAWWTEENMLNRVDDDWFQVSWDQSPHYIASGKFSELADVCVESNCGEWKSQSNTVGSVASSHDSAEKKYNFFHPAQTLCASIPSRLLGKKAVLRFTVSDGKDPWVESAIGVDTIVFSDKDCTNKILSENLVNSQVRGL